MTERMTSGWRAISLIVAVLVVVGCAQPSAAGEMVVDLGPRDGLALRVPEGWVMERGDVKDAPLVTLTFRPEVGDEFSVLLTPIRPQPGADPDFGSPAGVYAIVEAAAQDAAVRAVESELEIRPFEGDRVGFYFWATDRDLVGKSRIPPGEYLHLTQGAVMIGDILCAFTILTNDRPSGVIDSAMMMLRTAAHRTGA
ncbi:MAG: hypothetical protein JSU82_09680 [Rhodospirillales bacterium]|nr:MAG: hypothetical protein JSU82_09680 [Rhodospirillales bacterium]